MKIRIYYEDTDCGGIVYHSNYLKYCERARSQLFFDHHILPECNQVGFVVRSLQAQFLSFARLGDYLEVKSKIYKLKAASLELWQEIQREQKTIFTAKVTLVSFDQSKQKIVKIPTWAHQIFQTLEQYER